MGPLSASAGRGYTLGGMFAPASAWTRVARALVLTGATVAGGALAHTRDGVPALRLSAVLAVLAVFSLAWVAAARQVRWPVIALVLAAGQFLTHTALAHSAAPPPSSGAGAHHHSSRTGVEIGSIGATSGAHALESRMLLLHLGAWILVTLLFTVGERALWRSLDGLLTAWPRAVVPWSAPRLLVPAVVGTAAPLAHRTVLGRAPPLG